MRRKKERNDGGNDGKVAKLILKREPKDITI